MTAHRILFVVLDGISDRPCPALNGSTPLVAAETPVLDRLCAEGICGIMDTIAPGIRPGSDTAHLALLGYDPFTSYTGRGPLECEGTGIRMEPGMIGLRCNYATVSAEGKVTDRRAGRIPDTAALSAAIAEGVDLSSFGVTFSFRSGAGHRAALALRGDGLGHEVSSNDPKKDGVLPPAIQPLADTPANRKTAGVCNEFIRQSTAILAGHPVNRERAENGKNPANIVLMRGAGVMPHLVPFPQKYGLEGSVIAAASLITGIGSAVGLSRVDVPGITGSVTSDLPAKVGAAVRELEKKDFVLMNIKGADEAGHDGLAEQKRDFIARADAALEPLLSLDDCIIIVCGDHSTPCTIRDHSADPVPVLIRGDGVRTDDVLQFDEYSCAKGGLNRITGSALMPTALDLINRTHKFGA
jgi:2,3-bisphosphoglycerate-independent phosphoglycerate mutase